MVYLFCTIISIAFLLGASYYVKNRRLNFQYSIFWIGIGIVLLFLALKRDILEKISDSIGVYYPPAVLFLSGILFSIILIFYMTVEISTLHKRIIRLSQELGILKSVVERKEEQ